MCTSSIYNILLSIMFWVPISLKLYPQVARDSAYFCLGTRLNGDTLYVSATLMQCDTAVVYCTSQDSVLMQSHTSMRVYADCSYCV
jgi:hypothetical protein